MPKNKSFVPRSILPMVVSQPVDKITLRFRASGATNVTIFTRCITNLLHVATTNVVSAGIIGAYRIQSCKMFSIADGGSTTEFATIALTFAGGLYGKNVEMTAAGSAAMPGVIALSVPKNCSASFWHSSPSTGSISGNGEPLLYISSSTGGVIFDLTISYILCDGANPVGPNLTVVAATAGQLYTNSLDNSTTSGAVGSNSYLPVGRFYLPGFG